MSIAKPRGPLPARVYWRRRVVVLAVACALVFGVGRLLGGSGDPEGPAAQPAAADATSASPKRPSTGPTPSAQPSVAPSVTPSAAPSEGADDGKQDDKAAPSREPLAVPTGPCPDSDVRVQPVLREDAHAGGKVRLSMKLTTQTSPACNWKVSPETVVVRLSSGSDRIWSSQQCPKPVPTKEVVLRTEKPVLVDVFWNGRRSDPDCSRTTAWAEPGYYHLSTAALGAEPEDRQFRLLSPAPVTVTPSPTAEPKKPEREKSQRDKAEREKRDGAGDRERGGSDGRGNNGGQADSAG